MAARTVRITFKKTTRKEFEAFRKSFTKWQKRLGLTGWRVCFDHGDPGMRAYASIWADSEGRVAVVTFAKQIEIESGAMIGFDPVSTGRHEALELLLMSMMDLIRSKYKIEYTVHEEAKHDVIRRLEALFNERGML